MKGSVLLMSWSTGRLLGVATLKFLMFLGRFVPNSLQCCIKNTFTYFEQVNENLQDTN